MVDTSELEQIMKRGILKSFTAVINDKISKFPLFVIAGNNINNKNIIIQINVYDQHNFPSSILYPVQILNKPLWELIHTTFEYQLLGQFDVIWYRDWLFNLAKYINQIINPVPTLLWDENKMTHAIGDALYNKIQNMSSRQLQLWCALYGFKFMTFYYQFNTQTTYYYLPISNAYIKQYFVIIEHINERLEYSPRKIEIYFENENFEDKLKEKAEKYKKSRI